MARRRTVSELEVRLSGDVREALEGLNQVGTRAQKLGRNLRRTGFQLSRRFTLPLVAAGGAALKVAADFESGMNRVRGITGATGDDLEALEQQAKELGRTTPFTAAQAAEGMAFLGMAGFEVNEILGAMPSVLDLAAAAQMDLGQAADIASNILSGYRLEVEELGRVNDVLVKTFTSANTNVEQLGEAYKVVGPIASDVGIEFEEVAAALGVMADAGVQGQEAGTALRVGLGRLLNPVPKVEERLKSLGLTTQDVNPQMNSLTDIVGALENAGADASDILTIFGQRGAALAPLIGSGADAIAELETTVRDSAGAAGEMADVQMEGLTGALKELRSAAEGLAIAMAESGLIGVVTSLTRALTSALQVAAEINPVWFQMAAAAGAVLAAAGPVLTMAGSMATMFGLLLTPTGAVVAALAALAAAAVFVVQNWDELRVVGSRIWLQIKRVVFDAVEGILNVLGAVADFVPGLGDKVRRLQRDFERFSDQSLADSLESLEEQEAAMRETADEADRLAEKTAGAGKETGDYASAADEARDRTDRLREALDEADDSAGEFSGTMGELDVQTRRMFEDITRRITGEEFLPSDQIERTLQDIADGRVRLQDMGDAGEEAGERTAAAGEDMGETLERSLSTALQNFESLQQVASRVLSAIQQQLIDTFIASLFGGATGGTGFLAGLFGGGRQHGGPVRPGRAFLVGEAGPELFVPPRAGRIVPREQMAGARQDVSVSVQRSAEHMRNIREMREALEQLGPLGRMAEAHDAGFQRFLRAALDVAADQGFEAGSK
jgi:TP901 family phage tail tape measure protein